MKLNYECEPFTNVNVPGDLGVQKGVYASHYAFKNTEQDAGYPHRDVHNGQTVLRWDRNNTGSKAPEFVRGGDHGKNGTFYYKDPDTSKMRYLIDTGNMSDLHANFNKVRSDKFILRNKNNNPAVGDKTSIEYGGNGVMRLFTDHYIEMRESDKNRRMFMFHQNGNFCIGNTCINEADLKRIKRK